MALRGLGRLHTVDRVMRLKAEMLLWGAHRAGSMAACQTGAQHLTALGAAGLDLRAQLKPDEVFDVMKNPLAFLHRIPAREDKVFMHKDGPGGKVRAPALAATGSDGVTRDGLVLGHHFLFAPLP